MKNDNACVQAENVPSLLYSDLGNYVSYCIMSAPMKNDDACVEVGDPRVYSIVSLKFISLEDSS